MICVGAIDRGCQGLKNVGEAKCKLRKFCQSFMPSMLSVDWMVRQASGCACTVMNVMNVKDWRDFCKSSMELEPICKHVKQHMF